jgi:hypothetical protein
MVAVATIAVSCAWPPILLPSVLVLLELSLPRSMLLTLVPWNLACLVMVYITAYIAHFSLFVAPVSRFKVNKNVPGSPPLNSVGY